MYTINYIRKHMWFTIKNCIVSALIDFMLFIYYTRILKNEKSVDDSLNMYHVQYWSF